MPTFTKKHYERIARIMTALDPICSNPSAMARGEIYQWRNTVLALAREFATDNPQFDQERFLRACGISVKE